MELSEAISGRRSMREYTHETLDRPTIISLIEAAVQAPSAVNQQPWTFTVVRDPDILDRISSGAKLHMLADVHAEDFHTHLSDPQFHIFYHAPALILICATGQNPWIVEDCSLAAQNLMLEATGIVGCGGADCCRTPARATGGRPA